MAMPRPSAWASPPQLREVRSEGRGVPELGHQMVIVGVEPLGQLQGCDRAPVDLPAAGHGEVAIEIDGAVLRAEAVRNGADHHRGVEHVVVEREVVGGEEVDPGGGQHLPVVLSDLCRCPLHFVGGDVPGPEGLERPLERSSNSDPRHPVHRGPGGRGHGWPARGPDHRLLGRSTDRADGGHRAPTHGRVTAPPHRRRGGTQAG